MYRNFIRFKTFTKKKDHYYLKIRYCVIIKQQIFNVLNSIRFITILNTITTNYLIRIFNSAMSFCDYNICKAGNKTF